MHPLPTSSETIPSTRPADGAYRLEPAAWRVVDDDVDLVFDDATAAAPQTLRWRGSSYRVVGTARYWSTWHSFAVEAAAGPAPSCRGLRTSFWRFTAQTGPVGPILHFEVRGAGTAWRLVRLGADFGLPASS
jgi:hypothetical protein